MECWLAWNCCADMPLDFCADIIFRALSASTFDWSSFKIAFKIDFLLSTHTQGSYESSESAIPKSFGKEINEPYLTRYRRQMEWNVPSSVKPYQLVPVISCDSTPLPLSFPIRSFISLAAFWSQQVYKEIYIRECGENDVFGT
jgi:hypothetical protein